MDNSSEPIRQPVSLSGEETLPPETVTASPSFPASSVPSPQPTVQMEASSSAAESVDVLADEQKRKQIELELTRMGMSPVEVRRLLDAPADDPVLASARNRQPAPSASSSAPAKPPRQTIASLQTFAADLMAAKAAQQQKEVETAAMALRLPEFRQSSVHETMKAETLIREAQLLRKREKFKEAIEKCREALDYTPRDAATLEMLGDLFQGIAQTTTALAAYKRATEADPKRAIAQKKYADLLMRQQSWGAMPDGEAVPVKPWVAALLSLCLPGAGQFYNGETPKAAVFGFCDLLFAYLLLWSPWGLSSGHRGSGISVTVIILSVIAGVIYIAAVADAVNVAKKAAANQ